MLNIPIPLVHFAVALLDNVRILQDEIELTPNIKLISLTSSDKRISELLAHAEEYRAKAVRGFQTVIQPTCALHYHFEQTVPPPFAKNYNLLGAASRAFDDVLSAFQIARQGNFGRYHVHELVEGIESFTRVADPFIMSTNVDEPFVPVGDSALPLVLDNENDIKYVQKILEANNSDTFHIIRIVLTRLNRHFARTDFADQFLDAVIALEALYLPGIYTELQYRLGLRIAVHLGYSDSDRIHLKRLADMVYTIRSKIAHGEVFTLKETNEKVKQDLAKGGWSTAEHVLDDLIEALRKAVRSILIDVGEERFKKYFHAALDTAILYGQAFKASDLPEI